MKPETVHRIGRIINKVADHLTHDQAAALLKVVEHELRGQDRDTRHACAEAVSAVYTGELVMSKAEIIHAAHQACMNARSV